jgi:PII-like signaling protein
MRGLKGERVLMRIYIGERDRYDGKPLYEQIVNLLRSRGYAGATVFRGVMGFGASGRVSSDHIELMSFDLPLVIECVETHERIEAILPDIDTMLAGGLITLERAKVILYRPATAADVPAQERPDEHRIDITGDWHTTRPST